MKKTTMDYRRFAVCALSLGFLVVSALAFAQRRSTETNDRRQSKADSKAEADSKGVTNSTCLKKLTLTQQQQDKINKIVRQYEKEISSVQKQFSDRYMQMIRTEVLLLTAIEDNLTEAQRKQLRAQRRKTAQRQKVLADKDDKPATTKRDPSKRDASKSPASAVEEGMAVVGVSLTDEQQRTADKLQETYLSQLRSLSRDIEGLHTRLVSLEADKVVEIENVLTEDQLLQLRKIRQTIAAESNVQADSRSSTPSK